ncbi:MAG: 4-hydroxy-tetrahydrodipicolinate synthase [Myxococcota bacterium]
MFEGVLTALVTPFRDGAVDERALDELVEAQIDAGVDGLVPCGSTGEAATLSHAEHRRVIEVVVGAARGRVRVLAGTGSNSTSEAIELTRHAKEAGADGALLISPYYNKPTPEGIVRHFTAIAKETAFPLVVYNIPGRTASNLLPETFVRLAEIEQVVGVKESCGDLHQVAQLIAATPADFRVLSGDDWATLPMMALGGAGIISTTSNVAPGDVVELVRAFKAGDLARARDVYYRLLPLVDAMFCETNPIPVKAALAMRGLIQEELRLPLVPISDSSRSRLQLALKEFGLL